MASTLLAQEALTRLIPLGQDEGVYARNRLLEERPPLPAVGDRVWYRRHEWDVDEQLHQMVVAAVQPADDTTSIWATNLWQHLRSNLDGSPLFYRDGRPVLAPLADPLPWLHLIWPPGSHVPKGHQHSWKHRVQMTFESRMRGSPGWLPWEYDRYRKIHLSGQVPHVGMTAYRYSPTLDQMQQLPPDGDQWLPYP